MPEPDFLKRFADYIQFAKKEDLEKQYDSDIQPFLQEVADVLSEKYNKEKLYPHISKFRTHILFRLGLDKKMTHRASMAVRFGDDYIETGFDLAHALGDAHLLRTMIHEKTDEIANKILKLKHYFLWMPNGGIMEATPIDSLNLPKLKKALLKYNPKVMRECYFRIIKDYDAPTMTKKQLIGVFAQERTTFGFLLNGIKSRL